MNYDEEYDALSSVNEQETIPSNTPKASKSFKGIAFILILGILGAVGYFYVYPWYVNNYVYSPSNIYSNVIKEVKKDFDSYIKKFDGFFEYKHIDKGLLSTELSFLSNDKTLEKLADESYKLDVAIDNNSKALDLSLNIENSRNNFNFNYFIRGGAEYYTMDGTTLVKGELIKNPNGLFSTEESANKASTVDKSYVLNKLADSLIKSLNKNKIVKEDATINFNGADAKVVNYKYVLNKAEKERLYSAFITELKNDTKFMDELKKLFDISDIEKELNATFTTSEDSFNIYMLNNKFVGLSYFNNKKEIFHYYTIDKMSELSFDSKDLSSGLNYIYGDDNILEVQVNETINNKFVFKSEDNKDIITYYADNSEMFKVSISEFTNRKIALDFENINLINIPINGNLVLSRTTKSKLDTYSIDTKVNYKDKYVSIRLNSTLDQNKTVSSISTSKAVTLNNEQSAEYLLKLIYSFTLTDLGSLIK